MAKKAEWPPAEDVESALYDGFVDERDRKLCAVVRGNDATKLADFHPEFVDERLPELLLHYKGRNFPSSLAADEVEKWEQYRIERLKRQAPKFLQELQSIQQDLAKDKQIGSKTPEEAAYLVEELLLWYESLQPGDY